MVDHHILIDILKRRIKDEHFIALIWKFLKAGYVENGTLQRPKKGLHQGSLISPILANVYLNEFDQYMETYKSSFRKGEERKLTPEYIRIQNQGQSLRRALKNQALPVEKRKEKLKALKQLKLQRVNTHCSDPMDESYKRLFYQRYADDFLIGVIGSKADATEIKANISAYLDNSLRLELSEEKTLITHGNGKASFLGYAVTISKKGTPSKDKFGRLSNRHYGRVKLYIPQAAWLKKLKESESLAIQNGKGMNETWIPLARKNLLYFPDHKIVTIYNQEIRGLYQYYKIADNASVLNDYYYIMKYSMLKTLAAKHQSSIRKIMKKYFHDGHFQVSYKTDTQAKTIRLYDEGFKKQAISFNKPKTTESQELTKRLNSNQCEWCGLETTLISVHHVRKLSNLTGKDEWEQKMIQMNRKTLLLCPECHKLLNANLLR